MLDIPLSALAAQAFTGLVLGGIYVLMAIGLSLIFGLMTVVNFAHGSFYMLGAYVAFSVIGVTKSFWVALIVAPLVVGGLGFLVERFVIRRLYGRSPDDPLLLTFGLSLAMVEGAKLIWGKIGLQVDPPKQLAAPIDLGFMRDYLALVRREAKRRFDAGMPAEAAAADIKLGVYASWSDAERILPNVMRTTAKVSRSWNVSSRS